MTHPAWHAITMIPRFATRLVALTRQSRAAKCADRRVVGTAVAALAAVVLLGGCAKQYTDYAAFVRHPKPVVVADEYRIAPPDAVTVESRRVRELQQVTRQVRPDGKIVLPLLGSVRVAGKTSEELSAELSDAAQSYYEDAEVTAFVSAFNSKKIFVFGQVSRPGPMKFTGANTVLDTLSRAQPTRLADPSKIRVLRPSPEGDVRRLMTIDLNDMVKRGDTTLDAVLEEGDIIYVPANPLAATGLALQQLLLPLQPAAQVVQNPADISDDRARY